LPEDVEGCAGVYVQSDRQRLLQVLLNLLSNAVKYNRPDGCIELSCAASGGRASIAVTDTGMGISDGDLEKLFAPFERLGADGTGVEGTGVGLALSRVLSREMHGSLTVTSVVGTGSTFTLDLPAADTLETAVPAVTRPEAVGAAVSTEAVTVLAIEDNVANTRLLERIMERCENSVLLTAIQGRLGLELATQHHPDLILLDLHLPDLTGEAVLQLLQADPKTSAIPVVICSGDASEGQRRACLDGGAAAYLTKPYELGELYELIEQARSGGPVVQVERTGGLGGSTL
jgi:CheY-like chemotaxis protein/anti-sigma regulatory factor (Ser/Thr protein kinase)